MGVLIQIKSKLCVLFLFHCYPAPSCSNLVNTIPYDILLNPLNAELNPICHLLALLGDATIVVVSRLRVKVLSQGPSGC